MSGNAEILAEEYEVLESIFPEEVERLSEDVLRIRVEPEDSFSAAKLVVSLQVHYTPEYPDELPNLQLEALEGEITDEEQEFLIEGMKTAGTESLGMAMVFTLTSWLSQALVGVLDDRARKLKEAEDKKFAEYEEAEAAKKRGTPVTPETFMALQKRLAEQARNRRNKAEDERIRALTGKEREEYKKVLVRPTGRQLFETGKTSAQADLEYEDDDAGGEFSYDRYSREERDKVRLEREKEQESGGAPAVIYDSD